MPNIVLKRDAPFRGGFEGLLFFKFRWLRQSSVKGAPLSFTLGVGATAMLIGELSKRSGFSRDTIRYYEKLGIVAAGMERRAGSNYKNYPLAALERLHHIRRLKECGFTLLEIRRLLIHDGGDQACKNLPVQLTDKIMKIDEKMILLSEYKQSLLQIQRSCNGACSTIQGIPNCIPPVTGRKKAQSCS